jgi:hypothetical protein
MFDMLLIMWLACFVDVAVCTCTMYMYTHMCVYFSPSVRFDIPFKDEQQ